MVFTCFFVLLAAGWGGRAAGLPDESPGRRGGIGESSTPLPGRLGQFEGRFRFRAYGPEQGLKDSTINGMAQDAQGFLWIGTETGLLRYDGSQIRKWTRKEGLPESQVLEVRPDPSGGVWALTATQGAVLLEGGQFHGPRVGDARLAPEATSMVVDPQGRVWLLKKDGLYQQLSKDRFQRAGDVPPGLLRVFAVSTSRGSLLAFGGKTLWEWVIGGQTWKVRAELTDFPESSLNGLLEDGTGRLWLVGTRALGYLDGDSILHMHSGALPGAVYTGGQVNLDPSGRVRVPTSEGLLWLRGQEAGVLGQAEGLPTRWCRASLVDREGNLWVASTTLFRMLDRGQVRSFQERDGLPSDLVWCLHRDQQGRLWAGTNSGLAWLGPKGWHLLPGTEGLVVYFLAEDHQGNLWIAPSNHAPLRLGPGQARASEAPLGLKTTLRALYRDHEGGLWFSPQEAGGLCRINPSGVGILVEELPKAIVSGKLEVQALSEDTAGRLWLATNQGLFARDQGNWRRWTQQDGLKETALDGLAVAADGGVWVYYAEPAGATKVGLKEGHLQVLDHLDAQRFLPSDLVYALQEDPQGTLWVSTDQGVVGVGKRASFPLGRGPDRVPEEGNGGALLVEAKGGAWVGTTRGLMHLLLQGELPVPEVPHPAIVQVLWGGQPRSGQDGGRVVLSRGEATLEFRFSAPTYVDEPSVIYQVRLVGVEDAWRTTEVHLARYPSLGPGEYRFEVRAAYPGGAYGPVAAFTFRVKLAWWESLWFLAVVFLVFVLLVNAWIRWRIHRLARAKARLEAEVFERTHALHEANIALENQSLTDPLTGLHNRRFLSLVVEKEAAQVLRTYRKPGSDETRNNEDMVFFMVDLDHFKQVNDHHGHGVGDRILQRTAQVLKHAARESDAVIRMGGEEFLVLARHCSRAEAPQMAERIRSLLAQEVLHQGDEVIRWTASIGFAAFPFQPSDLEWITWERVIEIADACLFSAKKAGRNAWVGIQAREGLRRAEHGPRIPWEVGSLADEGVLEVVSSHRDPFGRRTGEVFG